VNFFWQRHTVGRAATSKRLPRLVKPEIKYFLYYKHLPYLTLPYLTSVADPWYFGTVRLSKRAGSGYYSCYYGSDLQYSVKKVRYRYYFSSFSGSKLPYFSNLHIHHTNTHKSEKLAMNQQSIQNSEALVPQNEDMWTWYSTCSNCKHMYLVGPHSELPPPPTLMNCCYPGLRLVLRKLSRATLPRLDHPCNT
jgi:hypothetical protein